MTYILCDIHAACMDPGRLSTGVNVYAKTVKTKKILTYNRFKCNKNN